MLNRKRHLMYRLVQYASNIALLNFPPSYLSIRVNLLKSLCDIVISLLTESIGAVRPFESEALQAT